MVGKKVEFKNPDTRSWWSESHPKPKETLTGTVHDKISEVHGRVARGWAMSAGSNNVAVNETYTYYMVAEDGNGIVHRLSPCKILKVCDGF